MPGLATNILRYLVCTVVAFRSPDVNPRHCAAQKIPARKIFDSKYLREFVSLCL